MSNSNAVDKDRTILGQGESWIAPSGATVTLLAISHKHRADGGAEGKWTFRFRGRNKTENDVTFGGNVPEAEFVGLDRAYVVSPSKVQNRLRVQELNTSGRFDAQMLKESAEGAIGLHGKTFDAVSVSENAGIVLFVYSLKGKTVFRVRVGAYTNRLWEERAVSE